MPRSVRFSLIFLGALSLAPFVAMLLWSLPKHEPHSTATLLGDGDVLVVGGLLGTTSNGGSSASALLYNPAAGTWTATGSLNTGRIDQTASLLQDGQVLVAGGETFGGHKRTLLASAELYTP